MTEGSGSVQKVTDPDSRGPKTYGSRTLKSTVMNLAPYWSGWVTPRQESWLRRDPSPAAAGSPGSSPHAGTWTPGSKYLTIQANIQRFQKIVAFRLLSSRN